MTGLRDSVLSVFEGILTFFHDAFVPLLGAHSWGWAIVALTLIVRILLLPLAIKQTRSMRAMQKLQPHIKELQKKYKVDRSLMKKDPEQYKAKRAKLNEELMGLYRREGANPMASCLPLLAQAPVFLALFWTLRRMNELEGQPFYFFTSVGDIGLDGSVSAAGWPGWLLIVLMSGTMFWSMRQTMARTPVQSDNPMAQQQKLLMYAMPVFLAVVSFQFPLGILLYWVTTNSWQVAQQAIILRDVKNDPEEPGPPDAGSEAPRPHSPGASSGRKRPTRDEDPTPDAPTNDAGHEGTDEQRDDDDSRTGAPSTGSDETDEARRQPKRDHLPRRRRDDER
ncbi:MAG: membrane protein insertase YidC [Nitriliruptoraceae bacterium]